MQLVDLRVLTLSCVFRMNQKGKVKWPSRRIGWCGSIANIAVTMAVDETVVNINFKLNVVYICVYSFIGICLYLFYVLFTLISNIIPPR